MEKLKRYIIFAIGLFINSLGVSFVTKANLGTSPISSVPYVLSLNFPFTLGNFTILFSLLLIVLQLIILRKNFKLEHVLQIPVSIVFGYFIDLTMILLQSVDPKSYIMKIIFLIIGCIILGFGVYLEVLADVAMLPGESFVRAVSFTWNTEFGVTKICFDVSITILAVIISFVLSHELNGVREGTVIAALLVGFIARNFQRFLNPLENVIFPNNKSITADETDESNYKKPVIVIGRQYGSGGYEIGKYLARKLNLEFYDYDIIKMTAGTTGMSTEYIEKQEEKMTNSFIFDLVNQVYAYTSGKEAPKDKIFEAESNVVKELADKGSCVIIGRCSDYVLRDRKNVISLFLHASIEDRISRVIEREGLSEKDAKEKIHKMDKLRADNYHYYTNRIWGYSGNYDLSIDTSVGEEVIEEIIKKILPILND